MRLYGAIQKVEPQDDGTVRVYGIATSEALDEQGEIVRADAPLDVAEPVVKGEPVDTEQAPSGRQPFDGPIQIWACTVPDHRHLAKADALKCLELVAGLAGDLRATAAGASIANDETVVS